VEPSSSPNLAHNAGRIGTVVCPVIVGRDHLLELADRRLREVAAGRGHLLFVAGEAGVGKTRLVGTIERRAAASGFEVVRAGTYPSDLQVPTAVLVDLARAMGRNAGLADAGAALERRLGDIESIAGDAHRRRRMLVLDVAELLAGLGATRPTLVVLEDLHWADDLTLEIMEALARRLADVPLLVVGTYRSDELYPRVPMREWRARLLGQRLAEEIRLGRLSESETATMVNLITAATNPVPQTVAAAIHARTEGVPLYVEELLGVLAATGLDAVAAVDAAAVPDTIEGTLVARIEHRSPEAASIARAGAVIGRAFDIDLLSAVVEAPPDRLSSALAELADHFILLPTRVPGRLGFRHALICDAIYDRIPELERRELHARIAEAARARSDVGTDAYLSLHYERAGRFAEAFRAALAGAQAATAISSHREASDLFERALRTAPPDMPDLERARLLEANAHSKAATDDNEGANDAFEAARAVYLRAGHRLEAAAVIAPLVAIRHLLGDRLEARAARLRAALAELESAPALHRPPSSEAEDKVRAQLLAGLAAAYMLDRRLDESIAGATESRRLAAAAGDGQTERHASTTLGASLVFAGRMDEGWSLLEQAIATSRAQNLEAEAARAYRMLGTSASVLVEYPRAERWLREGIEYAERVQLWNHRHYMAAHLGHVLWATGRWGEAEAIAAAALADGRGGVTTRITALHVLGYVALGRGDWARARNALDTARDLGTRMRELQRLSPALWGLAEVERLTGRVREGLALAEEGRAASAAVDDAAYLYPFVVTGTRLHLAAGDPGGAARWLHDTAAIVRGRGIPGTLPAIDHAQGLLALAEGQTGQARIALEGATGAWTALGRVWEGTHARIDLARCHGRANRRDQAARLASDARSDAGRIGSPVLEAAAADVLAAGRRRGDREPEPWAPLTAREFEVARLITGGLTNPEIAGRLKLSPKTVSAHLEHIMAKLDVGRRAEVAAWVASTGVLHSRPHGDDREE
jgi:DNA-binding CsgD family transcriptional regulator/tetratricopeptide (TPR) repeat protein